MAEVDTDLLCENTTNLQEAAGYSPEELADLVKELSALAEKYSVLQKKFDEEKAVLEALFHPEVESFEEELSVTKIKKTANAVSRQLSAVRR